MSKFNMADAARQVVRILMFEHWIRYYFVTENNDKLFIEVPEDVLKQTFEGHPELAPLIDMVNHRQTSFELSHTNVCAFINAFLGTRAYDPQQLPGVFDDKGFKIDMYMFNLWIKGHERHLDNGVMSFSEWLEMYSSWLAMDEVKAYRAKLESGEESAMADPDAATQ